MRTAAIYSRHNEDVVNYCVVDNLPTLVWAANLASLELHTSLARASDISSPTMVVFDLDPGPGTDVVQCCQVGLWVREVFDSVGLRSFAKTSGSKGLQVYAPLNGNETYDRTKPFAQAVAQHLEAEHPTAVTSTMTKSARPGKVFVDWSQNDQHKTTVCVYSLRARERPTVSTPVSWDEVEECLRSGDAAPLTFTSDEVLRRAEQGDLFGPVLTLVQHLPA